jgi:DNA topoisomerase-1
MFLLSGAILLRAAPGRPQADGRRRERLALDIKRTFCIIGQSRKEPVELKNLIIVESPTKARTIGQYLGRGYQVLSSQGHVRDLPVNNLGVDIEKGFEPKFETKRTKQIRQLRDAAKKADRIYLATDHDREGEAIAFDLYTILGRTVKDESTFSRLVFNEIRKPVILAALEDPEQIDLKKVEAQRARRILDRLMGYLVSPLLSRTLAGSRFAGLSAGRVQSVALRFLCDREAEISRFVPEEYWEVDAHLRDGGSFVASVVKRDGAKVVLCTEEEARHVAAVLSREDVVVASVKEKTRSREPAAPFITSSLQQSASSLLGFSPKRTMRIAQELYEGIDLPTGTEGLITYMRTDSVRTSTEAVEAARDAIRATRGERYVAPTVRMFKNKKRSQDAHEAIRPTDVRRTPEKISPQLSSDQLKLYALIYNRFVATQMAAAIYRQRKVTLTAGGYTLEAAGSAIEFDGFLSVLPDPRSKDEKLPPELRIGEVVEVDRIETRQKFTEPPRRYSEAGLVNLLEREGVGRPSTYAAIVSVIQERGYAIKDKGSLRPTLLGQMVVDFLSRFFSETVEPRFTAHLEEDLDRIEDGEMSRLEALNEFYHPFSERLAALETLLEEGRERPFRVLTDVACEKCGSPTELRYWKGTHFLGCSTYPQCRNTVNLPPDLAVSYDAEQLKVRQALADAGEPPDKTVTCTACGERMELRIGRYGRFYRCTNLECGATASISTGVTCPSCREGELVEKYSTRRRRTFYSCSRYPDCRFAVSDSPIKRCPACERGVVVEKSGELRCSSETCSYREPIAGEESPTPPPTGA